MNRCIALEKNWIRDFISTSREHFRRHMKNGLTVVDNLRRRLARKVHVGIVTNRKM